MRKSLSLLVAAAAALAPAPLTAQLGSTIDAGAVRVRYSGQEASSVLSVTPTVTFEHSRSVAMGAATLFHFDGGGEALQVVIAGSYYTPARNRLHLSLGGIAEGGSYGNGVNSGRALAEARVHWVGTGSGLWAGGSAGAANDALDTRALVRAEFGGWLQRDGLTLSAWVAPSRVQDDIRYTDLEGSARWAVGALELGAGLGVRTGDFQGSRPWGSATAAYWVTPHVALVGSGGSYVADPAQALPAGDYLSVAIRLASRPTVRRVEARRPQPAAPPVVATPVAAGFEVTRSRGDQHTIVVVARRARRVEIMGDFTAWTPVPLQPAGADRWRVTLPIAGGTQRFNIRVDGGEWGVPPDVTALNDEFSGVVAVLHLP